MVVGGRVHFVASRRRVNDLVACGLTTERGRSRTGVTIPVSRSVGTSAVDVSRW